MTILDIDQKEALQKSPLFNLSLASKELFHSNFWAWYFEQNSEDAVSFFNNHKRTMGTTFLELTSVKREQKNIDITLEFLINENGVEKSVDVLIENKIKSIPYAEQLDRYESKNGNSTLFLLSIYTPQNCEKYNFISYKELLKLLEGRMDKLRGINKTLSNEKEVEKNSYLIGLYDDYISFLSCLLDFTSGWKKMECFDFYSNSENYKFFHSLRIHDLYHKVKYNQLMYLLLKETKKTLPIDEETLKPFEYFSRGTGAASLWYYVRPEKEKDEIKIELQIQDSMIRLMLIAKNCANHKIAIEGSPIISPIFSGLKEEMDKITEKDLYPKNGGFNQYGSGIIYKNKRLKTTISIDTLVANASLILVNVIKYMEAHKESFINELDSLRS